MDTPSIENIEELEQQLIQHVRTAGLRKPREAPMIEEVMNIRRERRKLFSFMKDRIDSLTSSIADITLVSESKSTEAIADLQAQLETKSRELQSIKHKYLTEMRAQHERHTRTLSTEIDSITEKYETKLRLLDGKIEKLSHVKDERNARAAQDMARLLAQEHLMKLEKQYGIRIQK